MDNEEFFVNANFAFYMHLNSASVFFYGDGKGGEIVSDSISKRKN